MVTGALTLAGGLLGGACCWWTWSAQSFQQTATQWLWQYNHERPNIGIGGITPKQKLAKAA